MGYVFYIVFELLSEVVKRVVEDMYVGIGTVDVILYDNFIGGAFF